MSHAIALPFHEFSIDSRPIEDAAVTELSVDELEDVSGGIIIIIPAAVAYCFAGGLGAGIGLGIGLSIGSKYLS